MCISIYIIIMKHIATQSRIYLTTNTDLRLDFKFKIFTSNCYFDSFKNFFLCIAPINKSINVHLMHLIKLEFPISRSLSTSRRRTDELGYRLERPIHFECKLNEPMHIGMRLLHPAAADHSVSINRQQVQRIFSFSLRSRAVTSFCSWLLLNEWIQRVEHALRKTLVLVVRHCSGGGSSRVEWTAHIRLHYPLVVLQMTISPVCFSMLK